MATAKKQEYNGYKLYKRYENKVAILRTDDRVLIEYPDGQTPDIEIIPRGMYLKEIFGADDTEDRMVRLFFTINRKAKMGDLLESLREEVDYTQEEGAGYEPDYNPGGGPYNPNDNI